MKLVKQVVYYFLVTVFNIVQNYFIYTFSLAIYLFIYLLLYLVLVCISIVGNEI